jgi:hypothetical protein
VLRVVAVGIAITLMMLSIVSRLTVAAKIFILALVLSILQACALVPTTPYDSSTDKSITRLQKRTAQHFVVLAALQGAGPCDYAEFTDFYDDSAVALSGLMVRAKALPRNLVTVEQLLLLQFSFESLAKLHRLGCLSPVQVADVWRSFDASFSAILRLELAKKG